MKDLYNYPEILQLICILIQICKNMQKYAKKIN